MRYKFFLVVVALTLTGCGASAPVVEAPPEVEAPSGPSLEVVLADGGAVSMYDMRNDMRTTVGRVIGEVSQVFDAPAGGAGAIVSERADSSFLYLHSAGGSPLQLLIAVSNPVVFTAVWSPAGDTLAFGHYRPTRRDSRPAMGAGNILLAYSGEATPVGCSASRAVLAWLPGGGLLVRNTDNLYVVARDGCDTRASVDARRMHGLSASPDGAHIVYVHRELEYNRQTRAYEPDSTFMISGVDGADARTVVNFRYDPERFAWRPDGLELAYDVAAPDLAGIRAISIFDVETGSSAYLHPPVEGGTSEWGAVWSPAASRLLYRQGATNGSHALAVRTFSSRFPVAIPDSEGAEPLAWMDETSVVFRSGAGTMHLFDTAAGTVIDLPPASVWISGRRTN